jgi:succinoglycan biosynthesis protein ExoV
MKLYYHRNKDGIPNFGDDLNPWLWSRLLAAELDDDPGTMFLGIGTLLNDRLPSASKRVVFGTGYGIGGPPAVDSTWTFYAVRGPLSAQKLGLASEFAVTDPAILVSRFVPLTQRSARYRFSYMPHYRNACDAWRRACARIGFGYIDPRNTVDEVLAAIQMTEVVLAEAMHGAIIADTLRVPWIPIRSREKVLRFKWQDWCASMGVSYAPRTVSSLWDGHSAAGRVRGVAKGLLASIQLLAAARSGPTLSDDAVFAARRDRLEELLNQIRRDVQAGRFAPAPGAPAQIATVAAGGRVSRSSTPSLTQEN